eukprot:5206888-Pyramimonas_sp.AAC.1
MGDDGVPDSCECGCNGRIVKVHWPKRMCSMRDVLQDLNADVMMSRVMDVVARMQAQRCGCS